MFAYWQAGACYLFNTKHGLRPNPTSQVGLVRTAGWFVEAEAQRKSLAEPNNNDFAAAKAEEERNATQEAQLAGSAAAGLSIVENVAVDGFDYYGEIRDANSRVLFKRMCQRRAMQDVRVLAGRSLLLVWQQTWFAPESHISSRSCAMATVCMLVVKLGRDCPVQLPSV